MSVVAPVIITFRDRMRELWSPPWLRTGNAEKLLYALAVQLDVTAEALIAAVQSRFPAFYSDESLSALGAERRIARGLFESSDSYAARLTRWLDDHRLRGGPYAMLQQLFAYFAPNNFQIDLAYRNGLVYSMDAAGTITRTPSTGFAPDANPAQWARWWLFLFTDDYPTANTATIEALSLVPREWNAAHCLGTVVVLTADAELWNYPLGHVWNESGTWNTSGGTYSIPID